MKKVNGIRIGEQMERATAIVRDNPGCSKKFIAELISPHPMPEKNWALGYEPVNRAISAGMIDAEITASGTYRLTVSEFGLDIIQ